jgi:hypothetical protein
MDEDRSREMGTTRAEQMGEKSKYRNGDEFLQMTHGKT